MHVSYQRAAVAAEPATRSTSDQTPPRRDTGKSTVLWASRPLRVRSGRLVAVRLKSSCELEVGLVAPDSAQMRWVRADTVLTEPQAELWASTSRFAR